MAKQDYSVTIRLGLCGNTVGILVFDEDAWPTDLNAELKVTKPLTCKDSEIEVTCCSKRTTRWWLLAIKHKKHTNHTYLVKVMSYRKNKK